MGWDSMVWYGMVWYGMVRYDMMVFQFFEKHLLCVLLYYIYEDLGGQGCERLV